LGERPKLSLVAECELHLQGYISYAPLQYLCVYGSLINAPIRFWGTPESGLPGLLDQNGTGTFLTMIVETGREARSSR
jgi:hypothetical protein